MVLLRLIPLFPWDVINFGAGLCGLRFRQYLLATFMGIIPGSFLYNSIGAGVGKPFGSSRVILMGCIVLLSLGGPLIYRKIRGEERSDNL